MNFDIWPLRRPWSIITNIVKVVKVVCFFLNFSFTLLWVFIVLQLFCSFHDSLMIEDFFLLIMYYFLVLFLVVSLYFFGYFMFEDFSILLCLIVVLLLLSFFFLNSIYDCWFLRKICLNFSLFDSEREILKGYKKKIR